MALIKLTAFLVLFLGMLQPTFQKETRKNFSVTITNTSVSCCHNCSPEFFRSKFNNRRYLLNQDSLKVYGFDNQPDNSETLVYEKFFSEAESEKVYNFLISKRIDSIDIPYELRIDHYCLTIFTISGEGLPTKTIKDKSIFDPRLDEILLYIDRLIDDKNLRRYN